MQAKDSKYLAKFSSAIAHQRQLIDIPQRSPISGMEWGTSPIHVGDTPLPTVISDFKKIKQKELSTLHATPRLVEKWINDVLRDAHYLDIPGSIAMKDNENPLSHFGVDRLSLMQEGVGEAQCDRLYSSLFVYSIGFNTMIRDLMVTCQNKYDISSRLWKVFSMLLEFCTVLDHKQIITQIDTQAQGNNDKQREDYMEQVKAIEASKEVLKKEQEEALAQVGRIEMMRTKDKSRITELEGLLAMKDELDAEELELRMRFEREINLMHTKNLDKYQRLDEVEQLLIEYKQFYEAKREKLTAAKQQLFLVAAERDDFEQKFTTTESQLNRQNKVGDKLGRQVLNQEAEITDLKNFISDLQEEKGELKREYMELESTNEKHEHKILKLQFKIQNGDQNEGLAQKNLKEQQTRNEELEKTHAEDKENICELQQQLAESNESIKEKDGRIQTLYAKYQKYKNMNQITEVELNSDKFKKEYYTKLVSKYQSKKQNAQRIADRLMKHKRNLEDDNHKLNRIVDDQKEDMKKQSIKYQALEEELLTMQTKMDQVKDTAREERLLAKNTTERAELNAEAHQKKQLEVERNLSAERTTVNELHEQIEEHVNKHKEYDLKILKLKSEQNMIATQSKKHELDLKSIEIANNANMLAKKNSEAKYYELYKEFQTSKMTQNQLNHQVAIERKNKADAIKALETKTKIQLSYERKNLADLLMKMEDMRSVIIIRESGLAAQESATQKLKAKVKLRERELKQKWDQIAKLEKEVAKCKDSIGNLQRDLKNAMDDKKAQALEISKLKQQIQIGERERDELCRQMRDLRDSKEQLEGANNSMQDQIGKLNEENQYATDEQKRTSMYIKKMEKDLKKQVDTKAKMQKQTEVLKAKVEQLQEKIKEQQKKISETEQEILGQAEAFQKNQDDIKNITAENTLEEDVAEDADDVYSSDEHQEASEDEELAILEPDEPASPARLQPKQAAYVKPASPVGLKPESSSRLNKVSYIADSSPQIAKTNDVVIDTSMHSPTHASLPNARLKGIKGEGSGETLTHTESSDNQLTNCGTQTQLTMNEIQVMDRNDSKPDRSFLPESNSPPLPSIDSEDSDASDGMLFESRDPRVRNIRREQLNHSVEPGVMAHYRLNPVPPSQHLTPHQRNFQNYSKLSIDKGDYAAHYESQRISRRHVSMDYDLVGDQDNRHLQILKNSTGKVPPLAKRKRINQLYISKRQNFLSEQANNYHIEEIKQLIKGSNSRLKNDFNFSAT